VRHLLFPVDATDLVKGREARTQAAVNAKVAAVDDCGEGEVIENLRAVPPDVHGTVLAKALVVKPIHLVIIHRD
jgi:hypothetical protein